MDSTDSRSSSTGSSPPPSARASACSAAAKTAAWGLSGLEFGINIPGTAGGAVRMNANAYGGELGRVLEWVEIATAAGIERRGPAELGLGYRRSSLSADVGG